MAELVRPAKFIPHNLKSGGGGTADNSLLCVRMFPFSSRMLWNTYFSPRKLLAFERKQYILNVLLGW